MKFNLRLQNISKHLFIGLLACIFTSPLFFLIESDNLKFYLIIEFFIFYFFIKTLIFNQKSKTEIKTKAKEIKFSLRYLSICLFILYSIVFILNLLNFFENPYWTIMPYITFIALSFIPGMFFSELFDFRKYFSILEQVVLFLFIGIGFIGISWFSLVAFNFELKKNILLTIILFFSIINIKLYWKKEIETKIIKKDLLGLLIIFGFYICSYIVLYPDYLHIVTDISRHYNQELYLAYSPEKVSFIFHYLIQDSFESFFISISMGTIINNVQALLGLNLYLILAIYIGAKRVLKQEKKNWAIYVVFFFTVLNAVWGGGYPLIKFILAKITNPSLSHMAIANILNSSTQNSFLYSVIGLWNIPNYVNLTLIFLIIAIYFNNDMPKHVFIIISSYLIFLLFLIHLPEGVIVCALISCYYIFQKDNYKKTRNFIISAIIGNIFAFLIFIIINQLNYFPNFSLKIQYFLSFGLSLSSLLFSLIIHKISSKLNFLKQNLYQKMIKILAAVMILIFVAATFYKLKYIDPSILESSQNKFRYGAVPWYNYSLLGINFVFATLGVYFIKLHRKDQFSKFLILNLIVSLIFGTLISLINNYIIFTYYLENRFVQFIGISIAFLAPFGIIGLFKKLNWKNIKLNKKYSYISKTIKICIIFFVVSFNFLFISLTVETRYYMANSHYSTRPDEWEGVEQCAILLKENSNIGIFTLTKRGTEYLVYTGASKILTHNQIQNRNKTYEEFKYHAQNTLNAEEIYVFFFTLSGWSYFTSLEDKLQTFLLLNSSIYYKNDAVYIIGPLEFK